jgi:hypothetical protein
MMKFTRKINGNLLRAIEKKAGVWGEGGCGITYHDHRMPGDPYTIYGTEEGAQKVYELLRGRGEEPRIHGATVFIGK